MHVRPMTILSGLVTSAAIPCIIASCGGSDESAAGGGGGAYHSDAATDAVDDRIEAGGKDAFDSGKCTSSAACDGGVCVAENGGTCCDAKNVCGDKCCGSSSVCLFGACVTPGKACHTANDCNAGEYCEPALGPKPPAQDGGVEGGGADADPGQDAPVDVSSEADSGQSACSQTAPPEGKCLAMPPTCPADAGTEPDAGCLAICEYHPPSGGPLKPVVKWSWGPKATTFPDATDVWSTPTVGRIWDTNCDGKVDMFDAPVLVFVSGNVHETCCSCNSATVSTCHDGVLRMLDGSNGHEIWSVDKASASSAGFLGFSLAIGDVDKDGFIDIVAMTAEGDVVLLDRHGKVQRTSDKPYPHLNYTTGWGGGIAIADMDLDGFAEIAYGDTVWTTKGAAITRVFVGGAGTGGGATQELSLMADLDGAADGHLELLAGNTAYKSDGTILWQRSGITDGFPAVGDLDGDGAPEAIVVSSGTLYILKAADGTDALPALTLPGNQFGGPPTVADFDGDGKREIGVAQANFYSVLKPDFVNKTIGVLWKAENHDYSSSVTGSTVFDFEGDGVAEVIYADECFQWVYDGKTGQARMGMSRSSFTATEASLLADVDGDGHAEMVVGSAGVDMSASGWTCAEHETTALNGYTWSPGPMPNKSYRGIRVLADAANSWVGTRTLWSEHTYHVTNICDDRDNACDLPNTYGSIPSPEKKNWQVGWLNDFRQNVQDKGIFNAPDAVVALAVDCTTPVQAHVSVRNIGQASLPAGVVVGVFLDPADQQVGTVTTTTALLPGQTQTLTVALGAPATDKDKYHAAIILDPQNPKFHECREDNNKSAQAAPQCSNPK
ncbi:MAG: VCBS repeat-containing protein [Deltaproteobacteria bacterium]|nr:VCBS repeat-containing protein [Deltaproteobacteria bacterium]